MENKNNPNYLVIPGKKGEIINTSIIPTILVYNVVVKVGIILGGSALPFNNSLGNSVITLAGFYSEACKIQLGVIRKLR